MIFSALFLSDGPYSRPSTDLQLFAIILAFGATRDLKETGGSGFKSLGLNPHFSRFLSVRVCLIG
jgi:hypothetical protein